MQTYHKPVLVEEVLTALDPNPSKTIVDGTFGGGGHSSRLLEKGSRVIGIDHDQDAIAHAKPLLDKYSTLTLINENFSNIRKVLEQLNIYYIDGILLDLGVSSWQFDNKARGFSFQEEAELDMRMDQNLAVKAKDLLAALGEKELAMLFQRFGDEPRAKVIAHKIVALRKTKPLETTKELADLIVKVYGNRHSKLHPATKVFQALRIAVNDELNSLEQTLPQTIELLKPGGVLVVISFHEGEDRIVKQFIRKQVELGTLDQLIKPITPTQEEIQNNPRSRSAKLRVATKT
ncbi:MAG: 16S rRNA (cytosine(1402)-N(4))-methyltransferase [Candidatus Pacebacteria bacterium CG10_big_fil_rev_8_21_14_0_10_42_12]|nr:MAG: 16S rRNA (cytosine(1402)-N(4))-methyltransferase [Candidatus Pacebacteria bacterium CG10_big_fil_rev_8_21_14_0_10_42_12]